jgi:hypothetical protein
MQPSEKPQTGRSSVVPLLLALVLLSAAIAILSMLTLGFVGVMVALAGALVAFVGFQYLLWGWWLAPLIERREQTSENRRKHGHDSSAE